MYFLIINRLMCCNRYSYVQQNHHYGRTSDLIHMDSWRGSQPTQVGREDYLESLITKMRQGKAQEKPKHGILVSWIVSSLCKLQAAESARFRHMPYE